MKKYRPNTKRPVLFQKKKNMTIVWTTGLKPLFQTIALSGIYTWEILGNSPQELKQIWPVSQAELVPIPDAIFMPTIIGNIPKEHDPWHLYTKGNYHQWHLYMFRLFSETYTSRLETCFFFPHVKALVAMPSHVWSYVDPIILTFLVSCKSCPSVICHRHSTYGPFYTVICLLHMMILHCYGSFPEAFPHRRPFSPPLAPRATAAHPAAKRRAAQPAPALRRRRRWAFMRRSMATWTVGGWQIPNL